MLLATLLVLIKVPLRVNNNNYEDQFVSVEYKNVIKTCKQKS